MRREFETFLSTGETLGLFGRFMIIGFALGVIYNAARLIRLSAGLGRVFAAVTDFLFITLFGVTVFIFSVAYGTGELRLYYIIAAFFGFVINMATLGSVIGLLSRAVNRLLRSIGSFLRRKIFSPLFCKIRHYCTKLSHLFVEICQKIEKHIEKPKNSLKNKTRLVYNKYNNAKMGSVPVKGGENRNAIKARVTKIL